MSKNKNDNLLYLSDIDEKEIEEAYNCRLIIEFVNSYNNPFFGNSNLLLFERFHYASSTGFVMRMLKKYTKLKDWQIQAVNAENGVEIQILLADGNRNIDKVVFGMSLIGYFLQSKNPQVFEENGRKWRLYQFEPKIQPDNTKEIKDRFKHLYHLTPSYNVENIMKNGLEPRSENERFYYPNRVYLTGDDDYKELWLMAKMLMTTNHSDNDNSEYSLLSIKTDNLPDDIELYYGPNFDKGVYSLMKIPAKYISLIGRRNVRNLIVE